ncbi:MAG TPA: glycosyltransferase, partial [Chitinophagaceae bacterium]|nr:glycosyltransferase [Chitinophagaceae bacterium]
MPRILRIHNRLAVGGPVLNATYLTKYLAPEFETLLVVGEKEDHERSAEYLVDHLGIEYVTVAGMGRSINPASDYGAYRNLLKLIRDFRPDIVHTHAAKPGALGRLAAAAAGVPVIVHTFHGHVFHSYFNTLKTNFFIRTERMLARKSTAIVAISDQQKKELVQDFRIAPENKFRVIRLGLDLDKFGQDQEAKRACFRQEFGLADDEIAIGIIGRLVPVKNHYLFLKGLAHVLQNSRRKVKAFIIGDGETRTDLENMATQSGIRFTGENDPWHPHPLVFTSWRSDVDSINAGLDIVALTSFNEGTPVSLIEAQAANKPIVSTRVGGISDIVVEGETALLADVQDGETFCRHLLSLVEDDALRTRLGAGSREQVMERFSYQRLVKEMGALYY